MKKIFTLFAAMLTSFSLFAETESNPLPADVTADQAITGASYTIPGTFVAGGGSKQIGDMPNKGVKVRINKKYGDIGNALPFEVNEGKAITGIKIVGVANGTAANITSILVDGVAWNGTFDGALPGKEGTVSSNIVISGIEAKESVVFISDGAEGQALICYEITYEEATPSQEPVLAVSPAEVTLTLTAAQLADVAYVHFGGKNLTPGVYPISVPDLEGLRLDPSYVTVGDDGKLNEDVAIAYSSEVDVEANSTEISLTIDNLEAKVKVNYSADFTKNYLSQSVNIEQLVLDYGVNYDIVSEFAAAHIDFENINALDSLNDEKNLRNEPYLGLKLKTQGAFIACWLKEGDVIRVKFGFVAETVIGSINGQTEEFTPEFLAEPLEFTAPTDCYMKLSTTSAKTVVIKQIMLNEEIAEVVLPESPQGVENITNEAAASKCIENGALYIIKNGVRYDARGTVVK